MRKDLPIGIVILVLIVVWIWWSVKPPPPQEKQMGRIIEAVNQRQETVVRTTEIPEEIHGYLERLFEVLQAADVEGFRLLTHLRPNARQLAILQEIFFDGEPFCPATIVEYRRTRDKEEDTLLFPATWRPSSLEPGVRMYESSRQVVRVHSEKRERDYYLVIYDTSAGLSLLLAGVAK